MAKYRQIHIEFWQDGFVLDLTPEEKYFYLYLMTNSKTSQCGIYELPKKIIETETGYSKETVDKLLNRFIEYNKISYSEKTKEVMVKNWINYNFINSPKVINCIEKELTKVKDGDFVKHYKIMAKRLGYRIDTLSIDYGEEEEEEEEEEREEEREEEEELSFKYKTCDQEFSQLLYSLILENNEKAKQPDIHKWSDEFRLMRERDQRTEEQIKYLIQWSQADSFWKSNILSPTKLRKHFDQLIMRVKSDIQKQNVEKKKPRAFQSLADWADENE